MSLLSVFRYFRGYLDISVKGDCAEQFINICTKNKVNVWRVRKELGILKMRMPVNDYKQVRKFRKELRLNLKIKIEKKHGIRFKVHKYRKRRGLTVGLILFFAFLIFMGEFIWIFEVKGNTTLDSKKIISACKELGVYEGIYKNKIDTYNLPLKLILNLDGIAWCSFNIEGSKLTVEISEAKESDKDKIDAANIVAKRDGVIEKLEVTDGVKKVKIGQAVRKGDILASGVIDNGVRVYTVKAAGKIIAKTQRTFEFKIGKEVTAYAKTGRMEKRSVLNLFGIRIPLYLGNIKYDFEDKLYENKFNLFGQKLPIGISTRTFNEVLITKETIDKQRAENIALEMLAIEAKKLSIYSLKIEEIYCEVYDDEFICKIITVCSEDISECKEINIENELKNNK